jgi:hypothetical protein
MGKDTLVSFLTKHSSKKWVTCWDYHHQSFGSHNHNSKLNIQEETNIQSVSVQRNNVWQRGSKYTEHLWGNKRMILYSGRMGTEDPS